MDNLATLSALINKEGWEIGTVGDRKRVLTPHGDFSLAHPYSIHLQIYRDDTSSEVRYESMRRVHDMLWPDHIPTWNDWTEVRFRAHCERYAQIVMASGAGCAKDQPLWEQVLTPDGFVEMDSLFVGDKVCTPFGISEVTKIHPQGQKAFFRVTFDDGSSACCGHDHLWSVRKTKKSANKFSLWTCAQIQEYLKTVKVSALVTPSISPVQFNSVERLTIPPYLLGFLLGNGSCSSNKCSVKVDINKLDADVLLKVQQQALLIDSELVLHPKPRGSWQGTLLRLRPAYLSLGLMGKRSWEKHIPSAYLKSSVTDRWNMLRGLVDSDGTVSKNGQTTYSTTSNQLAEDVTFLVRSLGGVVRISSAIPTFTGKNGVKKKGRLAYRLSISALPMTGLCARKQARITAPIQKYQRRIVKVEYEGVTPTQCIIIADTRGLYLTKDFIVTHNSSDAAKIALIFWLSDPKCNACLVASTTLDSLESRIWGYVAKLFSKAALPIAGTLLRSKPPKILYPGQTDKIHGIFANAIRPGDDATTVSTVIGRHPEKRMMVILDEATDMNPAILGALANLEEGVEFCQLWAIGNSNSKNDLHGALATPAVGWDNIDPMRDDMWETTHSRGVCLYFNPFKSPAITNCDAHSRLVLGKFLPTLAKINAKKESWGENSDAYQRFTLGYWRSQNLDNTAISEQFLTENQVAKYAEWSGFYDLDVVAGLDPAFQVGGTGCLLRLGVFGQTADGSYALDFRKEQLVFRIDIQMDNSASGERQLAQQVVDILRRHNCPISNLALDATGVGRALGELIKMLSGQSGEPYRIVASKPTFTRGKIDPHIIVMSPSDMWFSFRALVQSMQIRGLDWVTIRQITSRLVSLKSNKLMLESKQEYKARMTAVDHTLAHSPDESDAMMLAVQAAILRFGFSPGLRKDLPNAGLDDFWRQKMMIVHREKQVKVAEESSYKRPNLMPSFSQPVESALSPSMSSVFRKR